jgi:hypothetical protein
MDPNFYEKKNPLDSYCIHYEIKYRYVENQMHTISIKAFIH